MSAACFVALVGASLSVQAATAPPRKPDTIPGWQPYVTTAPTTIPFPKPTLLIAEFGPSYVYLLEPDDQTSLRRALDFADQADWKRAYEAVSPVNHPIARQIIEWTQMNDTRGRLDFNTRTQFIEDHPNWPRMNVLKRHAEMSLTGKEDPQDVIAWFDQHPPVTSDGKRGLVDAMVRADREEEARALIVETWIEATFTRSQERRYYNRHKGVLSDEHHQARLERLLWDRHINSARRMMRRVDGDIQRLAQARIALMTSAPGVDAAIRRVPSELRSDPGLVFDRVNWRRKKGRYESAREALLQHEGNGGKASAWWRERKILARDALSEGLVSQAYEITSNHGQTDALNVSEAEFLAGWIALQFLDDSAAALDHFTALYQAVSTPVSLARGAYWAGRAAAAQQKDATAFSWYNLAAEHVTTYYGQLAMAELTGTPPPRLPPEPEVSDERLRSFQDSDLPRAARMLAEAGRPSLMRWFLEAQLDQAGDTADAAMTVALADLLNRTDLAVRLSRRALRSGHVLVDNGHPMPALPLTDVVEPALVFAIARQESNFDLDARSHAGAQGLMQLMPRTARLVSREVGERYYLERLSTDPGYNVLLGSTYLAGLLKRYDGHVPMAVAAYNAGPHRVSRWIRENGDPRKGDVDVIDWIELIPFNETRNYVQRVVENLKVYRQRVAPTTQLALRPDEDLMACWGSCDPLPLNEEEESRLD